MRTSSRGVRLIARSEGLRLRAYKPVPGEKFWTIGYGHYGSDIKAGQVITPLRARKLLRLDLTWAERIVRGLNGEIRWRKLNQHQFDALVSLVYNCGAGCVAKGTTIGEAVRSSDYDAAADGFRLWTKGGSPLKVLPGLKRRREAERKLFLKPVRERQAKKLNVTVAFDGVPVFRGLALMLQDARDHGWTGKLTSADRRKGVAERYGKMSQVALFLGWIAHMAGFNPANPPGRSTHELRSDGVAYAGPVGRPLAWHRLGLDATQAEQLRAELHALGYGVKKPYASGSEVHHTNCTRNPRRRLRKRGLV